MPGEILMGLSAFKTMLDIAKGLKNLNDAAARNAVAIELQEKILAAQAEQSTLIQRVGELEKEVARLEEWDADKQRYELKEITRDQFAYALKEEVRGREPAHMLCANCYNRHQKSILQSEIRDPGRHKVTFCQNCGSELFSPETGGRGTGHPNAGAWGRRSR